MRAVCADADAKGVTLFVLAYPHRIPFYERFGFMEIGTVPYIPLKDAEYLYMHGIARLPLPGPNTKPDRILCHVGVQQPAGCWLPQNSWVACGIGVFSVVAVMASLSLCRHVTGSMPLARPRLTRLT